MSVDARHVLEFWFDKTPSHFWFNPNDELKNNLSEKFLPLINASKDCELYFWRENSRGRLAEILLIEHFAKLLNNKTCSQRHSLALALAQEAIIHGALEELSNAKRQFILLPFIRSESQAILNSAREHFSEEGLEFAAGLYEKANLRMAKFGRFPERNNSLGRKSTETEEQFLSKDSEQLDISIFS